MNQWFAVASLIVVCFLEPLVRADEVAERSDEAAGFAARECYQRAAAALLAKNLPLAATELGRLVDEYPADELAPLAALRLAECHLAQGDAPAASELIECWLPKLADSPRTLALEPTSMLRAHFVGARADFMTERFEAVIKLAREQADLHARRSSLTAAEKSLLEQFRHLSEQATKRQEQALGSRLRTAADHVRGKQFAEALRTLEKCDPANLSPAWHWRYQVLRAQCSLGQGNAQVALKQLDEIALSKLTEQERMAVRMTCLEAAMAAQQADRAQAEIDALAQAAEKDEQLGVTIALRGVEVAMLRKDRDKVRSLALAAKKTYEKFSGLYEFDLLLARNAIAQIQFAEARQLLQAIIASPPATDPTAAPRANWLLGESYFLTCDYSQAMAAYTAVIEAASAPGWTETALMQRGKCYELLNSPAEATADYQRLLREYPQSNLCATAKTRLSEMQSYLRGAAVARPAVVK